MAKKKKNKSVEDILNKGYSKKDRKKLEKKWKKLTKKERLISEIVDSRIDSSLRFYYTRMNIIEANYSELKERIDLLEKENKKLNEKINKLTKSKDTTKSN